MSLAQYIQVKTPEEKTRLDDFLLYLTPTLNSVSKERLKKKKCKSVFFKLHTIILLECHQKHCHTFQTSTFSHTYCKYYNCLIQFTEIKTQKNGYMIALTTNSKPDQCSRLVNVSHLYTAFCTPAYSFYLSVYISLTLDN